MVNWLKCQLTEPPVTVKLFNEIISKFALDGSQMSDYIMQHFSWHPQAEERAIKLVIEASL